jgi:hypothetical protein
LIKYPNQLPDAVGMARANGRHRDNFSFDQLQAVAFLKDTALGHVVELVHAEQAPQRVFAWALYRYGLGLCDCHAFIPLDMLSVLGHYS